MSGSGWILHDGEGMPVDGETVVQVRYRNGFGNPSCAAKEYDGDKGAVSKFNKSWWEHQDEWHDIMAYKVVEK